MPNSQRATVGLILATRNVIAGARMSEIRILITGSRNWPYWNDLENVLSGYHWLFAGEDIVLVSGACPTGVDRMAEEIAEALGWRIERHPADWDKFGRKAGFIRNETMVLRGAEMCLAFILDDSKGATHCANLAEYAGITTIRTKRYSHGLSESVPAEAGVLGAGDGDLLPGLEGITGSPVLAGSGHNR